VYRLLQAFGDMSFVVYDPHVRPDLIDGLPLRQVKTKEELFSQSDIISFHIPLLPETRNFLSREDFLLLQPHVKLINMSR